MVMRYETFPAARVGELVARGVQLVDVREPHEYAAGRHPDAVSIPLGELPRRLHELHPHRPVAVICESGSRSAQAAELLVQRGFRRVLSVAGGLTAARRA
jgi:rhodanese-related sulfurtransferase